MDRFLWWSGVVAWGCLGTLGIIALGEQAINWAIDVFWTKREFLAFVAARLKHKRNG